MVCRAIRGSSEFCRVPIDVELQVSVPAIAVCDTLFQFVASPKKAALDCTHVNLQPFGNIG